MKKVINVLLVMSLTACAVGIYAHEQHHDTLKISATDSVMQEEMEEHQQMEAINAFPNYHPLIVHFPIVLLLMAVVFQVLSFFFYKRAFGLTTLVLLTLGAISAWLASNTFHAHPDALTGKAKEIFETHEQAASLTVWFSFAAWLIEIPCYFLFQRKWWVGWLEAVVTLFLIASAVSVSIAGHRGAMLVHMEGIGPMGKGLETHEHHTNDSSLYQCQMHPEVTSVKPGTCWKCGMQLERKQNETDKANAHKRE